MMNKFKKGLIWFGKSYLWLIPLFFIIDIVSKKYFESLLWKGNYSDTIVVIPGFFSFEVLYNTGAAWGAFSGQYWLLIAISSIAGIAMIWYLGKYYKKLNGVAKIALYLMIPGCLGNLIDRAFYDNGVIDFLKFTFGSYNFPTFNFADSCLVVGAILLVISVIVDDVKEKREAEMLQQQYEEPKQNINQKSEQNETKNAKEISDLKKKDK